MHVFIHDYIIEVSHLSLTLGHDAPLICYPTLLRIVKTLPWADKSGKTKKKDNNEKNDDDKNND